MRVKQSNPWLLMQLFVGYLDDLGGQRVAAHVFCLPILGSPINALLPTRVFCLDRDPESCSIAVVSG